MSYNQPLVSIDVVPVRFNKSKRLLEYATGERIYEPFLGEQALPGVLLSSGEDIISSAKRALKVKTDLPAGYLLQFGAFDGTNRDPRGATISIALLSIQNENVESKTANWQSAPAEMPFDHKLIVKDALVRLDQFLWRNVELTRAVLGETFTTADAIALGSPTPHASNASRWLESWGHVKRSDEKSTQKVAGRPAVNWEWIE